MKWLIHLGRFVMLIAAMYALTHIGMVGCYLNAAIVTYGLWKATGKGN